MKRISRTTFWIAAGIVFYAGLQPAAAFCALPSQFVSCYFDSPGEATLASVNGNFWGLGQGNPSGLGTDNGTYLANEWIRLGPNPGELYIAGDWSSNVGIHGCIQDPPNPQPAKMVVAISDQDPTGTPSPKGYFAAACVQENANGNFDYCVLGNHNPMVPIPKPLIASSTGTGSSVTLNIAPVTLGAGIYQDGTCGNFTHYKVYAQTVARNDPPPGSRDRSSGWFQVAGPTTVGMGTTTMEIPCTGDSDVYLATSLVIESDFETGHVSQNSTLVECGPNFAGKPKQFRLIKKPKGSVRIP